MTLLLLPGISIELLHNVPFQLGGKNNSWSPGSPFSILNKTLPPTVVASSIRNDLSPPLHQIASILAPNVTRGNQTFVEIPLFRLPKATGNLSRIIPPSNAKNVPSSSLSTNVATPIQNFDGLSNADDIAIIGRSPLPPDTEGAVGPNHYVQWVNLVFAVWSKSGSRLYGPKAGNSLWGGFGGPCETTNNGDPIVRYDSLADRFLMSQFALPNYPNGPFYQCIAVSQTADPTGAWYRYQFLASSTKMNDYPKFGVWPDGYYMSVNQFNQGSLSWGGAGVFAFERSKMLSGLAANMVYFDLYSVNQCFGGMLPSDLDGPAPPAGAPDYFAEMDDQAWGCFPTDRLSIWNFHVDWTIPSSSTFGVNGQPNIVLNTVAFDSNMCDYSSNCIPQPGVSGSSYLDALSDRLMYRLQYRNFGTYQTMVTCHTVDVDGTNHAGIRWYELRNTGSGWSIYQQGTFAPDSANRWMGSIAMNSAGNIALGYSVSSSSIYPSVRYTGRLATDPLGTMPQGENVLVAGSGSQTSSYGRWGDYSTMVVDPADDYTFWYTQEYYSTTSDRGWRTRIGSFNFAVSVTVTSNPTGTGFVTVDGAPIVTPQVFSWGLASTHVLAGSSLVTCGSGCQYVFQSWSDGGAQSHSITVSASVTTYTANFNQQFMLTTQVSPSGAGTVSVASGWQNAGATVPVTESANAGYSFNYWSLDGSNVGGGSSFSVLMNAAHTLTAFFLGTSTISLSPSSASITLGNALTLFGTITPTQPSPGISTGTTVFLSLSTDGGSTWSVFLTTSTTSGGSYSTTWAPPYPGSYKLRASWSGDLNYAGATSSPASLSVTGSAPPSVQLLVTGPSSASRGTVATFDVFVNETSSNLKTTLYIDITGPGGYEYFDALNVTRSSGSSGRYSFNWQIPNPLAPGTYQVAVGLIPGKAASFSQTQVNVT